MPWGFQEVEASRFQDNRHMKVVSPKHRPPLPPQQIYVLLIYVKGHNAAGMNNQ